MIGEITPISGFKTSDGQVFQEEGPAATYERRLYVADCWEKLLMQSDLDWRNLNPDRLVHFLLEHSGTIIDFLNAPIKTIQ